MTQCIDNIITLISHKLQSSGFTAMSEFSAVDSLIHKDEMLGVLSVDGCEVAAEAISHSDMTFCMETDYKLTLRLFGKSGDFVDYEPFSTACYRLFYDIVSDNSILVCKMEIGSAAQSMPLRRLERKLTLTVRVMERPEV